MASTREALALAPVVAFIACGAPGARPDAGTGPEADGAAAPADALGTRDVLPAADAGFVPAVGSPDRLDVATWNIENFPLGDYRDPRPDEEATETVELVTRIVRALRIDLIAVEEIADEGAFDAVIAELEGYDAVLSEHEYSPGEYQKIGFIYRTDALDVTNVDLLFSSELGDCPNNAFAPLPRPPLRVDFRSLGAGSAFELTAIAVHMKAGRDDEDRARRDCANFLLEEHISQDGAENVLVVGDFNETLDNGAENDPFANWPSDRYQIRTRQVENDFSFIGSSFALLDHAISTVALEDELAGEPTTIVHLEDELQGYVDRVSDHLPVVVSLDLTP